MNDILDPEHANRVEQRQIRRKVFFGLVLAVSTLLSSLLNAEADESSALRALTLGLLLFAALILALLGSRRTLRLASPLTAVLLITEVLGSFWFSGTAHSGPMIVLIMLPTLFTGLLGTRQGAAWSILALLGAGWALHPHIPFFKADGLFLLTAVLPYLAQIGVIHAARRSDDQRAVRLQRELSRLPVALQSLRTLEAELERTRTAQTRLKGELARAANTTVTEARHEIFDAHEVLKELFPEQQARSKDRPFELRLDAVLPLLDGNSSQFRQVVLGLLENARAGKPSLSLRVETANQGGQFLLQVKDTQRAETVFSTTFPIAGARPSDFLTPTDAPRRQILFRPARVLILDDEPDVGEILRYLLVDTGVTPEIFHDGPSALAALRRRRYDVVITDLHMPGMAGDEFIRDAREITESDTAFLMITGNPKVVEHSARADGYAILSKPFSEEALLEILNRWLAPSQPG